MAGKHNQANQEGFSRERIPKLTSLLPILASAVWPWRRPETSLSTAASLAFPVKRKQGPRVKRAFVCDRGGKIGDFPRMRKRYDKGDGRGPIFRVHFCSCSAPLGRVATIFLSSLKLLWLSASPSASPWNCSHIGQIIDFQVLV